MENNLLPVDSVIWKAGCTITFAKNMKKILQDFNHSYLILLLLTVNLFHTNFLQRTTEESDMRVSKNIPVTSNFNIISPHFVDIVSLVRSATFLLFPVEYP